MKAPLEVIAEYGIPTNSFVAAIVALSDKVDTGRLILEKSWCEKEVAEIIGMEQPPVFETEKHAGLYFQYAVQETIRAYNEATDVPDMDVVWEKVQLRINKLVEEMPWTVKEYTTEPKLDDEGKPKPKKGAKKELAKKVYAEQIEGKVSTRKEAIEILVKEVGLTPAGASTYYANLKKGKL